MNVSHTLHGQWEITGSCQAVQPWLWAATIAPLSPTYSLFLSLSLSKHARWSKYFCFPLPELERNIFLSAGWFSPEIKNIFPSLPRARVLSSRMETTRQSFTAAGFVSKWNNFGPSTYISQLGPPLFPALSLFPLIIPSPHLYLCIPSLLGQMCSLDFATCTDSNQCIHGKNLFPSVCHFFVLFILRQSFNYFCGLRENTQVTFYEQMFPKGISASWHTLCSRRKKNKTRVKLRKTEFHSVYFCHKQLRRTSLVNFGAFDRKL